MVIFHSYVKLPEGNLLYRIAFARLSRSSRDHSFSFHGDIFVVVYFRGAFAENMFCGEVYFRDECLLTLFRKALSRAFVPSYFPFAETP